MRREEFDHTDTRRRQRPPARRGVVTGIIIGVLLVISIISTAIAVGLFTGIITNPQLRGAPPNSNAAVAASNAPAAPPVTVTKQETYGDWLYTCFESPQNKQVRCAIAQHLTDSNSDVTVLSWQIEQDGKGGLIGTWQTPRRVLLNRGIALEIGAPNPLLVPFETCGRQHCRASAGLPPEALAALARAEKASATLVLSSGKPVTLPLSVNGLANGLAALGN